METFVLPKEITNGVEVIATFECNHNMARNYFAIWWCYLSYNKKSSTTQPVWNFPHGVCLEVCERLTASLINNGGPSIKPEDLRHFFMHLPTTMTFGNKETNRYGLRSKSCY